MSSHKTFITSLIFFVVFFGLLSYFPVKAEVSSDYGLTTAAQQAGLTGITDMPKLIGQIIGTALSMVGVIFFALMIYGGFLWMTARGNAEDEKKALNTIFGAVIGIIIILSAYALTTFVFKSLGGGLGSGGGNNNQSTITSADRNAECVKVNSDWSCNDIASCDGVTGTDNTACSADGSTGGCAKGKCNVGTDASSSKVVCCKAKTLAGTTCDESSTDGCAGQATDFACTTSDDQPGKCKISSGTTCGCVVLTSQNSDCISSDGKICTLQTGTSCPTGQVSITDINCQAIKNIVNNPTDNCAGGDVPGLLACINGGGVAAESCISQKCPEITPAPNICDQVTESKPAGCTEPQLTNWCKCMVGDSGYPPNGFDNKAADCALSVYCYDSQINACSGLNIQQKYQFALCLYGELGDCKAKACGKCAPISGKTIGGFCSDSTVPSTDILKQGLCLENGNAKSPTDTLNKLCDGMIETVCGQYSTYCSWQ